MHEKDRRPSTVGEYRNTVRRYLLPAFGADTLLHTFDGAHVDAYRERLLVEGQLSRWTIQKILVLLHGILKRAEREGWIAANPAADAERRTPAWPRERSRTARRPEDGRKDPRAHRQPCCCGPKPATNTSSVTRPRSFIRSRERWW